MRICETCGKNIDHKRADAKFCDTGCRARHRAEPLLSPDAPLPLIPTPPPPAPLWWGPPAVERGLSRAEVAALIEAALAPIRVELRRVDQSSAATDTTDALHARMETVEDRLFGERRDRPERPGLSTQSGPDSVVLGRLTLLEASVEVIEQAATRDRRQVHVELTELRGHLKAFMTMLVDALLLRLGLDLRAKVWDRLRMMG